MQAIVVTKFGDENVLRLEEVPNPVPQAGEVSVHMYAIGVNPVETYIRAGKYANLPKLPYIPGTDGAGVVEAVGENVQNVAAGDRVYIAASKAKRNTGTYAEYGVFDADAVRLLPDISGFAQGAGIGTPGLAASDAVFTRARLQPGETVLIHGATGGVGTLAVQLARRAGARVFGTAGDSGGEQLVRELGANEVFNHKSSDYIERIAQKAGEKGIDVVIEMLADVNLGKDLSLIAKRGRIVIVGSHGDVKLTPRDAMSKDAAILGMMVNNMTSKELGENLSRLTAAMETGLRVYIGKQLPLAKASEAHKVVMDGSLTGKVILTTKAFGE